VTLLGSGGTVSFAYDPFGRRIKKVTSSATSVFAYDGDNLVEETNASGTAVARYSQTQNIDEPLAMLRSSATSYFHADGLGSVTSLSSSAGSIANTYTYDSFGNMTASTGSLVNPFQYTARESDSETGLYYYRARYYDPNVGRFISEDPARYDFTSFYSYVGENPVLWQDPLGLWKCKNGDCGGLHPGLKDSLELFEKCSGLELVVTCGTSGHPPNIDKNSVAKADPHFWGTAVDIGHNNNPGLSMPLFAKCFQSSFPHKDPPTRTWGSYAQPEYNTGDPADGYHYHIQYFGGAGGGQGFFPNPIHPHGH
jgi:RHS repeat-associated protein